MNLLQKKIKPDSNFHWNYPVALEIKLNTLVIERIRKILIPYLTYVRNNADYGVKLDQSYEDIDGYTREYIQYVNSLQDGEKEDKDLLAIYLLLYLFNRKELFRYTNQVFGIEYEGINTWNIGKDIIFMKEIQKEVIKQTGMFIERLQKLLQRANTNKESFSKTWEDVQEKVTEFYKKRVPLIARNIIGNTFSMIQENLMTVLGITEYVWSVILDEKLRGNPEGKYAKAIPSHYIMEGILCRWDNPTVYSTDSGKTWKERTAKMEMKHPARASNCRCSALPWLVGAIKEIDKEIKGRII